MEDMRTMTAYLKTEALLTNYKKFKKGIENKELLIKEYSQEGIPKTSKSIVKFSNGGMFNNDTDFEKQENVIENLKEDIKVTKLLIRLIDKALKEIERDPYYKVIELKYFEDYTTKDIGLRMYCEGSTISRNRDRLVRQLSAILFSDDVITELYGMQ